MFVQRNEAIYEGRVEAIRKMLDFKCPASKRFKLVCDFCDDSTWIDSDCSLLEGAKIVPGQPVFVDQSNERLPAAGSAGSGAGSPVSGAAAVAAAESTTAAATSSPSASSSFTSAAVLSTEKLKLIETNKAKALALREEKQKTAAAAREMKVFESMQWLG